MTIDYLVADPSGNTTILVLTPVPKEEHSALAAKLLALPGIEAEQVGYVTREAGKPLRVDMMGGEFCGNASRSAAAWPVTAGHKAYTMYPARAAIRSCRLRLPRKAMACMKPSLKCLIPKM